MTGTETPTRWSVTSRDPDDSRWQLHRAGLCPHGLEVLGSPAAFAVRHSALRVGSVGMSQLVYHTEVRVTHRHDEDSFVVHVPLVGEAPSTIRGRRVLATSSAGAVIGPGDPVGMLWQAHSPHLMVRLERQQLLRTLHHGMGLDRGSLQVNPVLDLSGPRGRSWLELVDLIRRDADHGALLSTHDLARHHVEQLLMTEFLLCAQHPFSAEVHDGTSAAPAPTPTVRRARDLIHAHASEPLTVADVAEAVGVGVRSLQQGFRSQLGTTPTAYLRHVRLARVRAELAAADPGDHVRVTDVAFRWGFVHPGRFSQAYRTTYGETPSVTLAREPGLAAPDRPRPGRA